MSELKRKTRGLDRSAKSAESIEFKHVVQVYLIEEVLMGSLFKVGGVKLTYCNVFVLVALIAFPLTAEAFSRRADSSEVGQHRAQAHQAQASRDGKHDGKTETPNVSPQAVPEPPALWLLGISIGLFAIFSLIKRFRRQDAARGTAM